MLLLNSTSDLVKIITGSATNIDVVADYVDLNTVGASTQIPTPAPQATLITTAATTTVVGSPGTNVARTVKSISIMNRDAAVSNAITVERIISGTTVLMLKTTLLAGETLFYDEGDGWGVITAAGNFKTIVLASGQFIQTTLVTSASANFTTGSTTNKIRVRGVGGGGGGGGCSSVAAASAGAGGGGAGGYADKTLAVSPGTAYAYTCGGAGTGNSGAGGGNGGDSTFVVGATTVTAKGGTGAPLATAATTLTADPGGAGGVVGTNGDVNAPGQPGAFGISLIVATAIVASGAGGSGPFGAGGLGLAAAGAGNAALGNGGGGGGSATGASAARAGGVGTAGCWLVDEFT